MEGQENALPDAIMQQHGMLSPPPSSPTLGPTRLSTKLKKPPPITPKRFTRFFTPRNSKGSTTGRSGRVLKDITGNASSKIACDEYADPRPAKKRKISFSETLPSPSSRVSSPPPCPSSPPLMPSSPIQNMGARRPPRRVHRSALPAPTPHAHTDIGDFCSAASDIHRFAGDGIPFSVAACKTNTLVAIGTDRGHIRFIESGQDRGDSFADTFLETQAHDNAVTDLDFSHDDRYLATASGDQTARIIDMFTRQTLYILPEHESTVKRISWAPNSDRMVTTCGRDGTVGIWDLRYRGRSPVWRAACKQDIDVNAVTMSKVIPNAHATGKSQKLNCVTSLNFIHTPGREHFFLTSCEGNSQVRLWDIRGKNLNSPVSMSGDIQGHKQTRPYGMLGLSLSGDSSRVYGACRDGTVYTYSTNHLILGQAPEFSASRASRWSSQNQVGATPLYGITNPNLHMGSFYIRCALRPAKNDRQELLALGNSDHCPVLLPTDEASFHSTGAQRRLDPILSRPTFRTSARMTPMAMSRTQQHCNFPIYNMGAPLVRGHGKEVSVPCWNNEGDLITISDDFTARVWRQEPNAARELRMAGEGEGRRHMQGWADVESEYDEEDDS